MLRFFLWRNTVARSGRFSWAPGRPSAPSGVSQWPQCPLPAGHHWGHRCHVPKQGLTADRYRSAKGNFKNEGFLLMHQITGLKHYFPSKIAEHAALVFFLNGGEQDLINYSPAHLQKPGWVFFNSLWPPQVGGQFSFQIFYYYWLNSSWEVHQGLKAGGPVPPVRQGSSPAASSFFFWPHNPSLLHS